ncbi:MAG TPA: sugar transferase [Bacteroidales bacterium]|nr:sugar transferase [Bacteroidales bacterium]
MTLKFLFDRITAFIGIIFFLPLYALVAVLVLCYGGGMPILFRQQRVGKDGKLFTIYKFRTMHSNQQGSSVSVAGQDRITPIGAVLRKYKLDELPELWNVLVGDMSFVGPRPDVPGYADKLTGEGREILTLRPGITGPATLKYRNEEVMLTKVDNPEKYNDEVIFPDKVRINLYYVRNYSFIDDIKIILITILGMHMMYNNEII